MTKLSVAAIAILGLGGCASAATADAPYDGSRPILCTTISATSCDPELGCETGSASHIDVPQFFRVDVKGKKIRGTRPSGNAIETKIVSTENQDGKLILQGVENGRGWSLLVDEQTGTMTIAVAGRSVSFVVFGACTTP
jgi:hypothetical protein